MATISKAIIINVRDYGDEIKEFTLKLDKYRRFEAGTFLQLTLENVTASERWPDSRTFSISSYYNKDKTIRLIIKKVGEYTTKIFEELKEGSICTVKYAFGDFTLPIFDTENELIFIAGGTGISPFLSFLEYLEEEGGLDRVKLFYSARKKENFIHLDYIKNVLNENQLFLFSTREENTGMNNKRIELEYDVLKNIKNKEKAHYYICGSKEFILDFKNKLEENGITQIYIDEWD